ncbi:MAG: class II aldolase/adducin family protein [Sphingomonadaceae bacterium]|nr:class II aldolase/adducin family protein [Sphingomonadaceae bacterium]
MPTGTSRSVPVTMRDSCSADEWRTRVDLAAFYRLVDHHGWIDLIYNHISARVPDAPGQYLVNPYGMLYEEITASSLVKVDLESGEIAARQAKAAETNIAAHDLHGAVLTARSDLQCVAHAHTPATMAVSAMADGLLPLTQTAMGFYNRIGYNDYGIGSDACERLGRDFEGCDTVILRNHGVMVGGRTIAEAYVQLHNLQMACEAQVLLMAAGERRSIPSQDIIDSYSVNIEHWLNRPNGPRDAEHCVEWEACLRMLRRRGLDFDA